MFNINIRKFFTYIFIGSLFFNNIFSMEIVDSKKKENTRIDLKDEEVEIEESRKEENKKTALTEEAVEGEETSRSCNCACWRAEGLRSNNCSPEYSPISDSTLFASALAPFHGLLKSENDNPTESKLELQEPKMEEDFMNSVFEHLCPDSLKKIITVYENLEEDAFIEGWPVKRAILLYGDNGTGKSTLGVLMAKKLKIRLIFINSGFLGNMYKNSETVNLSKQIEPLLKSKEHCVVVMDEADALVGRNKGDEKFDNNRSAAVAQVIDMMQKASNFILVWTTNKIGQIDKKFTDRISEKIEVKLPCEKQRKEIIKYLLLKVEKISTARTKIEREKVNITRLANGVSSQEVVPFEDFNSIAKKTNGFSIRDLEKVFVEAHEAATLNSKKIINPETGKDVLIIIITRQNLEEGCVKVAKIIRAEKWRLFFKDAKEVIKDYGVVSILVGASVGVAGLILTNYWQKKNYELSLLSYELSEKGHELAKSSHELAKSGHELAKSSHELAKSSHELAKSSHKWQVIGTCINGIGTLVAAAAAPWAGPVIALTSPLITT